MTSGMTSGKSLALGAALAAACVFTSLPASAQGLSSLMLYARGEAGVAWLAENRGHWWGPGGPPGDPRITHDLDADATFFGTLALGTEITTGVRGDVSVSHLANHHVHGTWIAPLAGGPHADMDADVSSTSIMANIFVEPLALAGYQSPVRPFLTGGVGVAFNRMDDWTRTNPAVIPVRRTFEGATSTEFAWTVGAGLSAALGEMFGSSLPVMADLTYRYVDLGNVSGGAAGVTGGAPATEPFNYNLSNHVVTVGLRIPLSGN